MYFGAWVSLEDEDGQELRYRIVGPDEFDVKNGSISIDAPLGRALLKKQVDDEVFIVTPEGKRTYYVLAIDYEE
ncbi:GreA/GreB family elongation factor [Hahella ganghwensis]|uniref:GreA/GreB family elongation factor n=1 Tax=Hahella ganghwensis TaxID=286420 RepID=UPI00316AD566